MSLGLDALLLGYVTLVERNCEAGGKGRKREGGNGRGGREEIRGIGRNHLTQVLTPF